ncbi:hypothetical protein, partial [Aliivibrio finisterrensis]|uniref:hypothetical protein n=1 Tax=Aliivibrio finisterrensis TaxID=511998 RepID=UPI00142EAE9F
PTLSAIRGLTYNSANIIDYQDAIAAETTISDITALQALLDNVDASVSAFVAVQMAATSSNALNIDEPTLSAIRSLIHNSANVTDYQDAIASESTITDLSALQGLIDSVDASITAFAKVQAAATNSNALNIDAPTLSAIRGLTHNSTNMIDYQDAIAAESAITDLTALQGLIDSVDASVTAFAVVQNAVAISNASNVLTATLQDIRSLTFNQAALNDYQQAIEGEASITNVTALQNLIDSVDASIIAFIAVQTAATSSNALNIDAPTLSAIRGLTHNNANISDYQGAIASESTIADVTALQALIGSVDASINAVAEVQAAAVSNDANSIDSAVLLSIRGLSYNANNLLAYRNAIADETAIADVAMLQELIDSVDGSIVSFATVQTAATTSNAS